MSSIKFQRFFFFEKLYQVENHLPNDSSDTKLSVDYYWARIISIYSGEVFGVEAVLHWYCAAKMATVSLLGTFSSDTVALLELND